ncbi:HTH domain-containing protein [Tissierella praeacuta DSM 18095]|uniref:HTH domain-containing protein n=1 Tax=Tissierella praeacuta DSM 18095 TaxID=1123404 RepID=A0A1M4UXG5_9FIRM|nr:HTH domain-containing protein [Tissierella praeacuta]SHE61414.1 HTH domain-containing protein [Tissierella praeacuta DSM 18095]SUP02676.1 HTH domain [Tissierella praeacuta]
MEHDFLIYIKKYHQGKEKAVSSAYLQRRFSISSRTVRKIVNQLRNDGNPICSDENGYYYATDKDEVLNSVYQMTSRIREIAKAKNGLIKALGEFTDESGQLRLEIDEDSETR